MKPVLLLGAILSTAALLPSRAGDVISQGGNETTGKVTVNGVNIEVATGSSPTVVGISEVLEADFSEAPFQMSFFNSADHKGKDLPPLWQDLDIGESDTAGSGSVDDGTFYVTGASSFSKNQRKATEDHLHFLGMPWTGDGQWTVQIKEVDANSPTTFGGLMFRSVLEPAGAMSCVDAAALGNGTFYDRAKAGTAAKSAPISLTPPGWMRIVRFGKKIYDYVSADQQQWDLVGQTDIDDLDAAAFIGLIAHAHREKEPGKVTFTDINFGPAPASTKLMPAGVFLVGGSFVAGTCDRMSLGKDSAQGAATIDRNGLSLSIPAPSIAAITMSPVTQPQMADMMVHTGLVMKNGDLMDGDLDSISKGTVIVNSLLLGTTPYPPTNVRGCVFRQIAPLPSKYEVRLVDGSIIEGSDITAAGGGIKITDMSEAMIYARTEEIAQIRAGTASEAPLSALTWKATTQSAAPAKDAGKANAAPAMAPAPPQPDQGPEVGSWRGPNQETVLGADASTVIEFPLTDKIHALALKVAIASNSPSNAVAIVRFLADGREIGRSQPLHNGDPPRFSQFPIQDAQKITFITDSPVAGTKILYIDPVGMK